jgi:hypothetical protein
MKTITVKVAAEVTERNQYGIAYTKSFSTKKEAYAFLISLAKQKRLTSRKVAGLPCNVISLVNKHQSELVNIASFKINPSNVLSLLNAHGVQKFEIELF